MTLSFRTSDGYTLRIDFAAGVWTDGDLEFQADGRGWPVDHLGQPLPGVMSRTAAPGHACPIERIGECEICATRIP